MVVFIGCLQGENMDRFDPTVDIKDLPERMKAEDASAARKTMIISIILVAGGLLVFGLLPGLADHTATFITRHFLGLR